jgi:hypothetical protein
VKWGWFLSREEGWKCDGKCDGKIELDRGLMVLGLWILHYLCSYGYHVCGWRCGRKC